MTDQDGDEYQVLPCPKSFEGFRSVPDVQKILMYAYIPQPIKGQYRSIRSLSNKSNIVCRIIMYAIFDLINEGVRNIYKRIIFEKAKQNFSKYTDFVRYRIAR